MAFAEFQIASAMFQMHFACNEIILFCKDGAPKRGGSPLSLFLNVCRLTKAFFKGFE